MARAAGTSVHALLATYPPKEKRITQRVMVMLCNLAMRSERGGCVLNKLERNCPPERGATIHRAEVDGEMSMGIRLL